MCIWDQGVAVYFPVSSFSFMFGALYFKNTLSLLLVRAKRSFALVESAREMGGGKGGILFLDGGPQSS